MSDEPDPSSDSNRGESIPDEGAASLPEITVKAVILGVVLSAVLAGANAYLGLLAGMTVSASIPAAVISMAVLRLFRRSNILENNIVQTAASAGEALAAGVIFTFPALLFLGTWTKFNYGQTTLIAALGGLLGVLFTVPLRRALIVESTLPFPEGLATAQVLRVGRRAASGIRQIVAGGLIGALFKLGQSGLKLWQGSVEFAARIGGSSVAYVGGTLAPALAAVGYIVGINVAVLIFLGGAANWFVAIPLVAAGSTWPTDSLGRPAPPAEFAWTLWSSQTRYIGVGAMVVGGLWAVVRLAPSLLRGIRSSLDVHRAARRDPASALPAAERDVPIRWIGLVLALSVVPLYFVFRSATGSAGIAAVMAVVMLVAGFLFSAVASYMAGLVGSSNNPISGVTIATILCSSLLLLILGMDSVAGPAAAILIGAVICCAAAIGGDNMQDLKTGRIVGATPWKQQVMQTVGVLAGAAVIAPVLSLLQGAYGIGSPSEARPDALPAPQATLMASVARGVFARNLPWGMVAVGMALATIVIAADVVLERRRSRFRAPVLAVAVGIYLPLELGVAILAGGLVAWAGDVLRRRRAIPLPDREPKDRQQGVLLAAGLITGEALLGILLAVPIVLNAGKNPLDVALSGGPPYWPGAILWALTLAALLRARARPVPDKD